MNDNFTNVLRFLLPSEWHENPLVISTIGKISPAVEMTLKIPHILKEEWHENPLVISTQWQILF